MKYFVSYTTRDKEITMSLLRMLSDRLRNFGEVFIDIIDNNSMDRQARVLEELDASDVLILIESKSINDSEWVSVELRRAELKKIPIKRVSLEDIMLLRTSEWFVESGQISKCM